MAVAIAINVVISVIVNDSVAITATAAHCRHCQPLPLQSPLTIATAISVAWPSAIAVSIAVAIAIGHCRHCQCQPSQLPSPLAITVTIAVGHFRELLPWRSKNCIRPIEANNAYLILFCLDSGRCIE